MTASARTVAAHALGVVGGSIAGAAFAHLFLAEWLVTRAGREMGGRMLYLTHPNELTGSLAGIVLGIGVAPWFAVPALIVEHHGGRRPPWWVVPVALAAVWLGVAVALARRIAWMAEAVSDMPKGGLAIEPMVTVSSLELGEAAAWGAVLAGVALLVIAVVRRRRQALHRAET